MKVKCGENYYKIEQIIDQYHVMLFRLSFVRMKNKEDAEDVVQDTFLRLLQQINNGKTFENEEHLKAWLLTVCSNRGKSILTTVWNKRTEGLDSVKEMVAPEEKTDYALESVMQLPEKYRTAITLFYYEQLSTEQIASIMKTKPATVRSYLHRGREKLKKLLEEDA